MLFAQEMYRMFGAEVMILTCWRDIEDGYVHNMYAYMRVVMLVLLIVAIRVERTRQDRSYPKFSVKHKNTSSEFVKKWGRYAKDGLIEGLYI